MNSTGRLHVSRSVFFPPNLWKTSNTDWYNCVNDSCSIRYDILRYVRVKISQSETEFIWKIIGLDNATTGMFLVWFSSKHTKLVDRAVGTDVRIGDVMISPSDTVRDLGVTVDHAGSMHPQISSVCSFASYALWRIEKIRNLLDQVTAEMLIHTFVISRLDFRNSLYFGFPEYLIKELQLI